MELLRQSLLQQQRKGRPILVVDDEPVIRDLCVQALTGYRVYQAENGEAALGLLEREPVDLVLTDVMMPLMDGMELLRRIKEREPNQAVIVMTGFSEKEVILRALKLDADDFISKPINLLQLRTTLDKVLQKKDLKEELLQLKRMDRLKSDFLGLISHKLRTPTTAISLFVQNLARGIGDPSEPDFQQNMQFILEESRYLDNLIQDLLVYSDIILQEGPPRLAPVDLPDLIAAVLRDLEPAAAAKKVQLTALSPPSLPQLKLDRKRFGFALRALLDNAVKFTLSGGSIALTVEAQESAITLVIRDTGPGISPAELPKVFEKFYQIDPCRAGQIRGFGLGLFYARQFVQDHGGSLQLESEPGRGTEARIVLPLPAAAP